MVCRHMQFSEPVSSVLTSRKQVEFERVEWQVV
jgi:hypothetical protein